MNAWLKNPLRFWCATLLIAMASGEIHAQTEASDSLETPDRPEPGNTEAAPKQPEENLSEAERERIRIYSIRPPRFGLGGFVPYAPRFGRPTGKTFDASVADALRLRTGEQSLLLLDWKQPLTDIRFDPGGEASFDPDGKSTVDGGVHFDVDGAHVYADKLTIENDPISVLLDGGIDITRDSSSLTAGHTRFFDPNVVTLDSPAPLVPHSETFQQPHPLVPAGFQEEEPLLPAGPGVFEAQRLTLSEPNRAIEAESISYDFATHTGEIDGLRGRAGPTYFYVDRLRILGPADAMGEDLWVTTCDLPVPHYRIRLSRAEVEDGQKLSVKSAVLQIGRVRTPLYLPRFRQSLLATDRALSTEIDMGNSGDIGFFLNVAQWFRVTPNVRLAPRLYPTTDEGFGYGMDGEYDFMDDPTSIFYRSRGSFQTLYTTEERGYTEAYHRQEVTPNQVLLGQWEQWYDQDFVKDFYDEVYENRSGPRTFMDFTQTRDTLLASVTVSKVTHDFTTETEKLPELSLHVFERRLGGGLYGTFDGAAGYYRTAPGDVESGRAITLSRLTYDINVTRGFNLAPFVELDGTWYSDRLSGDSSALRGGATGGITMQSRLQRSFKGIRGFSGFKHIIVPSMTISHRPQSTLDTVETPRFDALDDRPGRTRLENTFDNVLLGRNAETGQTWQLARLTLYHGSDFWNEVAETHDYEAEVQIRPRPWWGFNAVAETHDIYNQPGAPDQDFDRLLSYVFFDNKYGKNTMNARIGFVLNDAGGTTLNRELLYGFGYKFSKNWSFAAEHRYNFDRHEITRQVYSIRRRLHKWELGFRVRERESGLDVGFEINLTDFPGARLGL